jgi:glycosyltransferase involved in cell wall biosynthesis
MPLLPSRATRYAVVITHNRPELLRRCVQAIARQVDLVLVLDNASDPPVSQADYDDIGNPKGTPVVVYNIPDQPPNIAKLWNHGLGTIRALQAGRPDVHHIAFLCDDAIVPTGWFSSIKGAMIRTGAAAGAADPHSRVFDCLVKTEPDRDITNRMPGWAYILDGTKGVVPDETMRWWWCDTDVDWQARGRGGMVLVGGPNLTVHNEEPNHYTNTKPELAEQTGVDRLAFEKKWGYSPW